MSKVVLSAIAEWQESPDAIHLGGKINWQAVSAIVNSSAGKKISKEECRKEWRKIAYPQAVDLDADSSDDEDFAMYAKNKKKDIPDEDLQVNIPYDSRLSGAYITGATGTGKKVSETNLPVMNKPKFSTNFEYHRFRESVFVNTSMRYEFYKGYEMRRDDRRVGLEAALQYSSAASAGRLKRGRDLKADNDATQSRAKDSKLATLHPPAPRQIKVVVVEPELTTTAAVAATKTNTNTKTNNTNTAKDSNVAPPSSSSSSASTNVKKSSSSSSSPSTTTATVATSGVSGEAKMNEWC